MITPAYAPTATERVLPRLALDFTTGTLDPRVTVTRALNTATAVNSSGNIAVVNANLPRFDYDPVTLAPKGLLIEETRTNVAVYSNDVTGTGWTVSGLTTSTPTNSPDGTANAVLLLEDNSTGFHRAFQAATTTAAPWSVSAYFKPGGRDWVWLRMSDNVGIKYAWFNVATGVVGTVQSGLTATISRSKNGFYRCTITAATAANGAAAVIFGTADADNSSSFTGDPTKGIYFFGLQIEAGAFATSYIPTTTTSLTRNADVVQMTGTNFSNWYNASEGAFGVQVLCDNDIDNAYYVSANDGTSSELMGLRRFKPRITTALIIDSGATVLDLGPTGTFTLGVPFKATLAYKLNNCATAVLGNTPSTDASVTLPTVDRINIGARNGGLNPLNGWIQKLQYWPQRIINAETQAFSK